MRSNYYHVLICQSMIRSYKFSYVLELGLSKKFDPLILACILRALYLEMVTKREGPEPVFV